MKHSRNLYRAVPLTSWITYAYVTYKDVRQIPSLGDKTVILIKAPPETTLQVPHPDEGFQIHLKSAFGPIEALLCFDALPPVKPLHAISGSSPAAGRESSSHTPALILLSQVSSKSVFKASPEQPENTICRITHRSDLQPKLTQQFLLSPTPPLSSSQPSRTDGGQTKGTQALAVRVGGQQYLLSLAGNDGISQLFSAHLDQSNG
ncbi:hypothetical protein OJAV_G00106050 [Oryzias javanicus]|uniref:E2F transcription factor CC-MB domain-containing protein n=1 Tax=Oryzias javanicus TaxID=123683 RepID=A0A3S2U9Z7_ORYJA|nr:hypothetical protein OJAV_G00106050 [Oryzias javanicus]